MSDPQEAATPSDPHSAEARAKYPDDYNGWSPQGIVIPSLREGFDAGRVSRDTGRAKCIRTMAKPTDVFWNELAKDLEDPEFLRDYIIESIRIDPAQ